MKNLKEISYLFLLIFMIGIIFSEAISINIVEHEHIIVLEIPVNNSSSGGDSECEDSKEELEDFYIKNTTYLNSNISKKLAGNFYWQQLHGALNEILTPPPEFLFTQNFI